MTALGNAHRHKTLTTGRVDAHTVALMAAQRALRIGARMRERRLELGLSQPEIASRIGGASVTKDYISRWELGKTEPSEGYLDQIAGALETTVADLMAGAHADQPEKGEAPELNAVLGQPAAAGEEQLDRIERKLDEILKEIRRDDEGDAADDEGGGPLPAQPPGPLHPPSSPSEAEPESQEEGQQPPGG